MNIVKNIHKLADILSPEEINKIENLAATYKKDLKVVFKILSVSNAALLISASQLKNPAEQYLSAYELNEKAMSLLLDYFPEEKIIVQPITYQLVPPEVVDAPWIQFHMMKHNVKQKRIAEETGISKEYISPLINGKKPLSDMAKSMFYYYFTSFE